MCGAVCSPHDSLSHTNTNTNANANTLTQVTQSHLLRHCELVWQTFASKQAGEKERKAANVELARSLASQNVCAYAEMFDFLTASGCHRTLCARQDAVVKRRSAKLETARPSRMSPSPSSPPRRAAALSESAVYRPGRVVCGKLERERAFSVRAARRQSRGRDSDMLLRLRRPKRFHLSRRRNTARKLQARCVLRRRRRKCTSAATQPLLGDALQIGPGRARACDH